MTGDEDLSSSILAQFKSTFSADVPQLGNWDWNFLGFCQSWNRSVLMALVTMEELKHAVFNSKVDRAPRPNGFLISFF